MVPKANRHWHSPGDFQEAGTDSALTRSKLTGITSHTRNELLQKAEESRGEIHIVCKIQVRLNDAVEGVEYPRQIDGPVAERSRKIDALFCNGLSNGNLVSLTDKIYSLMKSSWKLI